MPPRPVRRPSHSTPPSVTSSRYADDDRYGNGRYASPQYRKPVNRARTRAPSVDSQDTYYDPRDKYYLSGGDDDDGWAPRRGRAQHHSRRGRAASPTRSDSSSSRSPSPPPPYSSRASTDRRQARARSTPQHRNTRDSDRRRPRAAATTGRYRSPSPTTRTRSTPAHNRNNRRRRRSRSSSRSSSSSSRSSSRSRSPSPSHKKESGGKQSTFALAAHNAMEAAAIAALKLRHDPSPWLGAHKGGKIAAAALGAAVVDTLIARHAPHRKGGLRHTVAKQAAQMVIGGLVMPKGSGEAQKMRGWKGKVGGVGRGVARGMAGGGLGGRRR